MSTQTPATCTCQVEVGVIGQVDDRRFISGKGIILDTSSNNVLQNLTVHDVDDEGIHFRAFSTDNVLKNSHIYNTGKKQAGFGEGVYIGSANSPGAPTLHATRTRVTATRC
ncbi:right-handed parallel beta-helix repeat-containing protein [Undibacterium sp. KW1]|uniref:right-handed parallel beta-helix repeat-containing protein n=1 Tax=Undibacterium sp. KW1 TaxID=2058624 RepID=UPI00138A0050|nr:right-handed parallel beta-helix repeat-containing protein [Undibacterium sp. KW1]